METVILIIFISFAAVLIFYLAKNEVTFIHHKRIANAIHRYCMHKIITKEYDEEVHYTDMEPYDKTLKRFWDWGYTRILPKDKFEIIKPFLED